MQPMNLLAAFSQSDWLNLVYLLAAVLFIFGLKMLSKVATAKRGNFISALGMLLAACATFFYMQEGQLISLVWIAIGLIVGAAVGLTLALKVQMTAMPQMVALLNGFGGVASLLVAIGDYGNTFGEPAPGYTFVAVGLATLIGGVTFTGSLVAFGKLQGLKITPTQPIQFAGQKALIFAMLLGSVALTIYLIFDPQFAVAVVLIALLALTLGVLLVIGIGGADMPVVIALLNSYSGLAAAMAGFVLVNQALIITGSLVGASGLILTNIMCKAMNRSLMNVLFGGVGGAAAAGGGSQIEGEAKSASPDDAALALEAAESVMIVPGYGMAVAQAQHAVKDLVDALQKRGVEVNFAIHPVAGRMPGHMNVLLAESGVPYDLLKDLDQSNGQFDRTAVALVIGANDVTNPDARHNEGSPLYGMPILNVDQANTVFVVKRSLSPGFAGIQNPLYFADNTRMIFGDAKTIVTQLVDEVSAIG